MILIVQKSARTLFLKQEGKVLFFCPLVLGRNPLLPKDREGDGRTPEGEYRICVKKLGKYGPSLGLNYPNMQDALRNHADEHLLSLIEEAEEKGTRPPWGSFLGGEIYIHGGGTRSDWTEGCVALADEDAKTLYDLVPLGTPVQIVP